MIEKHFTLDRNLPGPDHRASLEPNQLSLMVKHIRNIEMALGDGVKRVTPSECNNAAVVRKSLMANGKIKKGEEFTPNNISIKRPGIGISPMRYDEIIGRLARKQFDHDDLIEI